MRNGRAVRIFLAAAAAAAVLAAVVMTLLSAVPPLSYLYDWAKSSHMSFVWAGTEAGVIALCLSFIFIEINKNGRCLPESITGAGAEEMSSAPAPVVCPFRRCPYIRLPAGTSARSFCI